MRYEVFERMHTDFPKAETESDQAYMERIMRMVYEMGHDKVKRLNEYLAPAFVACDHAGASVTARFGGEEWKLNPVGVIHGGIIASSVDTVCGTLVRFFIGGAWTVTTQLSINYLHSAMPDDTILVTATLDRCGRRLKFLHADVRNETDGTLIATATAQFI